MNTENHHNPYMKGVLLPYIVYIMLFIGTGFLSGAVVHFPINPSFFLVIGLIGVIIFTVASTVQEAVYNKKNLKEEGIIPFIIFSVILSIGIGMISGGVQHFEEYPLYASSLIPTGIAISFITFVLKNNLKLNMKQALFSLLVGGIVLVPMWFLLNAFAHSFEAVPHGHGEETLSQSSEQAAIIDEKIFVALEGEGSIAVVDPENKKLLSKISLSDKHADFFPHNVQSAPDGTSIWVTGNAKEHEAHAFNFIPTAYADEIHEGDMSSSSSDEVIVINPETEQIIQRIKLGRELHLAHVVLTPDNKYALITAQKEGSIYVVETSTFSVIKKVATGLNDEPHGLRITPDGKTAYIAMLKGRTVGLLDIATWNLTYQDVRGAAVQTAVTENNAFAFVTLFDTKQIGVHDRLRNSWGIISLPKEAKGPLQLYPTHNSKYLYVADQGYYFDQPNGNTIYKINIETKEIAKIISAGNAPHGVVLSPNDRYVYVSNILGSDISVIDTRSDKEIVRIPVGKEPNGITYWKKSGSISESPIQGQYTAELLTSLDNVQANKPVNLRYRIKDGVNVVKDFAVSHEKLMHLILVRQDLQYFQHLHPEFDKTTGEFVVTVTFPADGRYRLFPDFTVLIHGENKGVTLSFDMNVGNAAGFQMQMVVPESTSVKTVADYTIQYRFRHSPIKVGQETMYSLFVQKDGKVIKNLENYLGSSGHSVILKEGTLDFIHTHALENMGKDRVEFRTMFPTTGRYKMFTQFQHEGKVMTTEYVVEVYAGSGMVMPSMDMNSSKY